MSSVFAGPPDIRSNMGDQQQVQNNYTHQQPGYHMPQQGPNPNQSYHMNGPQQYQPYQNQMPSNAMPHSQMHHTAGNHPATMTHMPNQPYSVPPHSQYHGMPPQQQIPHSSQMQPPQTNPAYSNSMNSGMNLPPPHTQMSTHQHPSQHTHHLNTQNTLNHPPNIPAHSNPPHPTTHQPAVSHSASPQQTHPSTGGHMTPQTGTSATGHSENQPSTQTQPLTNTPPLQKHAAPPPASVQKLLDENNQFLLLIYENQIKGRSREAMEYQQKLHRNLVYLASLADSASPSQNSNVSTSSATPSQYQSRSENHVANSSQPGAEQVNAQPAQNQQPTYSTQYQSPPPTSG